MPWGRLLENSLELSLGAGEPAIEGERQENGQRMGGRGEDAYTNPAPSYDRSRQSLTHKRRDHLTDPTNKHRKLDVSHRILCNYVPER